MTSVSGVFTLKKLLGNEDLEFKNGSEVFTFVGGKKLRVPMYQREIKWENNRVDNLIDDIFENGKFIGIIYLNQAKEDLYEIIDGQQRLSVLLMILSKINSIAKANNDSANVFDFCDFRNESFPLLFECINNGFSVSIDSKDDVLNQFKNFQMIWNEICLKLNYDYDKICEFREHLLDCTLNVLISKYDDTKSNEKLCVEYYIDINNKSVPLDKIDILKAYIFRADSKSIELWNKIQLEFKDIVRKGVYDIDNLFLHYFLVKINSLFGKKLVKGINDNYKITKAFSITADGVKKTYVENTDIEEVIGKKISFYKNMLNSCISFIKYMNVVLKNSYSSEEFKSYFNKFNLGSSVPVENAYLISNDIIRCSDKVPKVLLFKYFVEVIESNTTDKKDFEFIYYIGTLATIFSTSKSGSKSNSAFASMMLDVNWKSSIKERAYDHLLQSNTKYGYTKGISDSREAQYLSKRYHALQYCAKIVSQPKSIKWNPNKFKDFMNNPVYNDEHFVVCQSNCVSFEYRGQTIQVEYPATVKAKINNLANLIRIKKSINDQIGNNSIKDKIHYIKSLTEKDIFEDDMSKNMFQKAEKAFLACPSKDELNLLETVEAAKEKMSDYLNGKFESEYSQYINLLVNK